MIIKVKRPKSNLKRLILENWEGCFNKINNLAYYSRDSIKQGKKSLKRSTTLSYANKFIPK